MWQTSCLELSVTFMDTPMPTTIWKLFLVWPLQFSNLLSLCTFHPSNQHKVGPHPYFSNSANPVKDYPQTKTIHIIYIYMVMCPPQVYQFCCRRYTHVLSSFLLSHLIDSLEAVSRSTCDHSSSRWSSDNTSKRSDLGRCWKVKQPLMQSIAWPMNSWYGAGRVGQRLENKLHFALLLFENKTESITTKAWSGLSTWKSFRFEKKRESHASHLRT